MGKRINRMDNRRKIGLTVGGGLGLIGGIALRCAAGSPLPVLRLIGADTLLPPLWLVGVLWLAGYALAGGAAGYLSACPVVGGRRAVLLWRGGTFLALSIGLSFCWYSCLFGAFHLLLSWVCLVMSVGFALLCTLSWWRVNSICAIAVGLLTIWLLCLVLFQFVLLLRA